ncbi:hypothetical protein CRUP_015905 [Coryphaenoides rupestris]|nr:hypothetical protein CRUP_015905 [Coryphaenoides rupestris]
MTEEQTWVVVQHNNTEVTPVAPSQGRSQHSVYFQYTPGDESLSAILSQSEGCEQELTYYCRKSRLLNTLALGRGRVLAGQPAVGRGLTRQPALVGSSAGSQLCACGLQHDCLDTQHHCNCDSKWANVSGLLTQKEMLPETSYLHFPTFHAELSADISFLFKTTASSGVFLENLGIKDFLRIELTCKQCFSNDG